MLDFWITPGYGWRIGSHTSSMTPIIKQAKGKYKLH